MAKQKKQYPIFQFNAESVEVQTLPGGEVAEVLEATVNNRRFQFIRYNHDNKDIVVATKFSTQSVKGQLKQAVVKALRE